MKPSEDARIYKNLNGRPILWIFPWGVKSFPFRRKTPNQDGRQIGKLNALQSRTVDTNLNTPSGNHDGKRWKRRAWKSLSVSRSRLKLPGRQRYLQTKKVK